MSTTEQASQPALRMPNHTKRRQPVSFAEWFVVLNGMTPLVLLMYDSRMHFLGSDPIRNALHTTGALALGTLTLTLAITPIRRLSGWDWLVEYRRPLGLIAFFYGLAHVAVYVGYDQNWDWNAAWQEFCERRYLQFGGFALLLLVPLALTSSPWWVNRLSFRRWKLLHRLIYPAAILAVVHYWVQSKADLRWQIGFIAALSGLLVFRLIDWCRNRRTSIKRTSIDASGSEISKVTIEGSGPTQSFDCDKTDTILEAAERNQIPIPSMCRSGICGTCRVQLVHGSVAMRCERALSDQQRDRGVILACQATCDSANVCLSMLSGSPHASQESEQTGNGDL